MVINPEIWSGKNILVTGHTGFKGSWLSLILHRFGANTYGISLPEVGTKRSLYADAGIGKLLNSEFFFDINDEVELHNTLAKINIDYVFHLAAQSLVKESYNSPIRTFRTNIIGTANLLLECFKYESLKGIAIATTDKVYKNDELGVPFKESDQLGGYDPYSASKASAEIIVEALKVSMNKYQIPVTTIRAGNVIGGGDWSNDRLAPDIVRAVEANITLEIRKPSAIRPWQHVIDCLLGYLLVAQSHFENSNNTPNSINFGPQKSISVKDFISEFQNGFEKPINYKVINSDHHEQINLTLDSSLASKYLNWHPLMTANQAIRSTAKWYSDFLLGGNPLDLMNRDLEMMKI